LKRRVGDEDETLRLALERGADSIAHLHALVRDVLLRLRPPGIDELGLCAAVEALVADWNRRCAGTPRLSAHCERRFDSLPAPLAAEILRIVQEAVTNAVRHADARLIVVTLSCTAHGFEVEISDDGRGCRHQRRGPWPDRSRRTRRRLRRHAHHRPRRRRWPARAPAHSGRPPRGRVVSEAAPLRIMLVDDHAVVRAGYRALLDTDARFVVVAEAGDGESAYARARDGDIDVLVMDLSMPGQGGLAAAAHLAQRGARPHVLVFTMHAHPSYAVQALTAGALGYVTKSSPPETLLEAIACVARGQRYLSADIAQLLAWERFGSAPWPARQPVGARIRSAAPAARRARRRRHRARSAPVGQDRAQPALRHQAQARSARRHRAGASRAAPGSGRPGGFCRASAAVVGSNSLTHGMVFMVSG
jgi:DNA-binding NarL/FixJ family response regulator